ncbi:peptidoglycan-binding protein [Myxococcus sp. CA051A]|uniref:peptidoglycan-binding domain-containing protein n=1 Tax=unclassified Myxococcus TaxID=2648731 RepID=UPI00157B5199|nr:MULTISPECIES: peptidoglycan-binding domain-containing protein [unclassified Myxococcus]NTX08090.1 peptidoglycan-binding protein [Myxococcus sp. CA040A]NTX16137.1 peptidoglycan-binding protein [Myxococcus sp. CA056]NTX39817.1 peptidoglycan-binding protein [Myxococcus sp. CA033]NTX56971.1 peptidoglycan-binding protein [Myxococcus sp. CA039A]NTX65905.1 peptidoglycan-binding protein [Myxococcus sp. CA051A]
MVNRLNPGTHHTVREGESVESIAYESGHVGRTLWNHAENEPLRKEGRDPNALAAGDVLYIPPFREKKVTVRTGAVHKFTRRGVPSVLRFLPLVFGQPMPRTPFTVVVEGKELQGKTTDRGLVECFIRPDAPRATVYLGEEPFLLTYELDLRMLAPVETPHGTLTRLRNLGLHDGPIDNPPADVLEGALRRFQEQQGLPTTGELDARTRETLLARHGR